MKIKRLKISDFRQFKAFDLDLTYPAGHRKAGEPLDKICLIGQSGTGKTTLLKLVKDFALQVLSGGSHSSDLLADLDGSSEAEYLVGDQLDICIRGESEPKIKHCKLNGDSGWEPIGPVTHRIQEHLKSNSQFLALINFPAEQDISFSNYQQEPPWKKDNLLVSPQEIKARWKKQLDNYRQTLFVDFGDKKGFGSIWNYILNEIVEYRTEYLNWGTRLLSAKNRNEEEKTRSAFNEWQKANPNPLELMASKCLDPLLEPIKLKTKTSFDFDKIEELQSIQIETLNSNLQLGVTSLSTGVRHILSTAIPLFMFRDNEPIILFDEPERSLYPDIQYQLINYYTQNLSPKAQFVFATHSPIIASAFEPWEVVELCFDEKGNVYRRPYFKGANHVDNYFIDPRVLRWDNLLNEIFHLPQDGNEPVRNRELMKLARFRAELRGLKEENKIQSPEGKEKIMAYKKLAAKLGWEELIH